MELSEMKPQKVVDKNVITVYKVVSDVYDKGALAIEKRGIEEQLKSVMTDEQLLEWARVNHPQPRDEESLKKRLAEIEELLNG